LGPNALAALRRIGLEEAVRAAGAEHPTQRHRDVRFDQEFELDLAKVWGGLGVPVAVHRRHLHRILREAAATLELSMATTVTSLSQGRGHRLRAKLSSGRKKEYDLVIGADGVHSSVRQLVFPGAPPRFVGQNYWRGTVPLESGDHGWRFVAGRGLFIALIELGGELYIAAQANSAEPLADPVEGRRDRLLRMFDAFGGVVQEALGRLERDDQMHFAPVEEVIATEWCASNVVLIGDAAHACSPVLAQGGALALEDAVVLAEELASDGPICDSLVRFVKRRVPRVEWVRSQTHEAIARTASGAAVPSSEATALARQIAAYAPLLAAP
jgi:2-polyprenyl-6-methoxyphenol hydroxylase-like FAD-dependent oxidoreductase